MIEIGKFLLERALKKSALFLYMDFLVLFVKKQIVLKDEKKNWIHNGNDGEMKLCFWEPSISKLNVYIAEPKKRRHKAPPTWVNEVLVYQSKGILYQLTKRVYHNIQEK